MLTLRPMVNENNGGAMNTQNISVEVSAYTRVEIKDPDGGTHYCARDPNAHAPWHLIGCGRNFATPEAAQAWLHEHWNDPAVPEDTRYARMEASFGEQE